MKRVRNNAMFGKRVTDGELENLLFQHCDGGRSEFLWKILMDFGLTEFFMYIPLVKAWDI